MVSATAQEDSARHDRWARRRDVAIVLLLAPALLIVGALVAAAVALDSPGRVLYCSRRIGHRGRPFKMWKFRKMLPHDQGLRLTLDSDHRFTPIGEFITRTNLDELPQFWNVLRGDMRLVGPRPELEFFVNAYPDAYREILTVVPGMTGPSQVMATDEGLLLAAADDPEGYYRGELMPRKIAIDLAYVRSRTHRTDVQALLLTFGVPMRKAGARAPVPARHLVPAAASLALLGGTFLWAAGLFS
jgi:lipopolysaccharide/colanic/teichoic acid biosynthesis glycosyltransferase